MASLEDRWNASDGGSWGVSPPAAVLDSRLPDIDWSVPPAGSRRLQLPAPSGSLAALAMGNPAAPAVVLVPGVMGSKEDFSLVMPLLAASGYYVLSYDIAGQYESAAAGPEHLDPPGRHYDYRLYVEDLLTILAGLNGPAHVLGHSFSGVVSALGVLRSPEAFRSLVLMSTPPVAGLSFRAVPVLGPFAGLVPAKLSASLIVWGVKRNFVRVPPARMRFVHQRFALTRRRSVQDIMGLLRDVPDFGAQLAQSAVPKLVAVGEHDIWPNQEHADFASAVGARLAVYRGGHSPCETNPHQLTQDLLSLYERASKPAA